MTPLRLDSACCYQANWRTDLLRPVDPLALEGQLIAAGWSSHSRHPALKVLRHPQGHEMAWVLPTGRIQIRVDLDVPESERPLRAEGLYGELESCLDRLTAAAEVEE
ncbi:MAG: hypothetical protein AAF657_05555 [Acidobacteriota bacterium]